MSRNKILFVSMLLTLILFGAKMPCTPNRLRTLTRTLLLLTVLFIIPGCGKDGSIVGQVVNELITTQIHVLIFQSFLWCVIGGFFGFFVGVLIFFGASKLNLLAWEWTYAWVFRWIAALAMVFAGILWGGAYGGLTGIQSGGEVVMRKSQLSRDALPLVASHCSLLVADFYLHSETKLERTEKAIQFRLKEFSEDKWQIPLADLEATLNKLSNSIVDDATSRVKDSFRASNAVAKDSSTEKMLFKAVDVIGAILLQREAKKQLKKFGFGADKIFENLFKKLPEAAAQDGDPKHLSFKELTDHFVQQAFVPLCLIPLKQVIKSQKFAVTLLFFFFNASLVSLFVLFEWIRVRWLGGTQQGSS